MSKKRRVVVTGVGIISPNGIGNDACFSAMIKGVSAIKRVTEFDVSIFNTNIAICELRPIQMKIHGDIAILQYLIFTVEINSQGGKRVIRRYTMTWKKGKDCWQVIASHNNLMDEAIKH